MQRPSNTMSANRKLLILPINHNLLTLLYSCDISLLSLSPLGLAGCCPSLTLTPTLTLTLTRTNPCWVAAIVAALQSSHAESSAVLVKGIRVIKRFANDGAANKSHLGELGACVGASLAILNYFKLCKLFSRRFTPSRFPSFFTRAFFYFLDTIPCLCFSQICIRLFILLACRPVNLSRCSCGGSSSVLVCRDH